MRVRAVGGGACEQLVGTEESKGELALRQPQMLPGNDALLLTIDKGFSAEQSSIAVVSLKTGKRTMLFSNATNPHYVSAGYIVFGRAGSIWAVPFDLKRRQVTGYSAPLIDGVANNNTAMDEQFAVGDDGTLVYAPGTEAAVTRQIMEADRGGTTRAVTTDTRAFEDLSLSPDGRRLAVTIEGPTWNIWTFDLERHILTRLTFQDDNRDPVWDADGEQVIYTSLRHGQWGLYRKAADGADTEKNLFGSANWLFASSCSPDRRRLSFVVQSTVTAADIWLLPLGGGAPSPFLQTPFTEWFPQYSPDGRWITYESNESGRPEIFVQPASGGGKWQISTEGGVRPVWPRSSKEIFYLDGNKLMAVPVETSPTFSAGTPHEVFKKDFFLSGHYYDATADGRHFYFIQSLDQGTGPTEIKTILHWTDNIGSLMRSAGNSQK